MCASCKTDKVVAGSHMDPILRQVLGGGEDGKTRGAHGVCVSDARGVLSRGVGVRPGFPHTGWGMSDSPRVSVDHLSTPALMRLSSHSDLAESCTNYFKHSESA